MIKSFVAFVGMRRLERPTPTSRTLKVFIRKTLINITISITL